MMGRGSQERHHTVRIMTTMPVLVSLPTSVSLLVPVDGFVFCFLFFFLLLLPLTSDSGTHPSKETFFSFFPWGGKSRFPEVEEALS